MSHKNHTISYQPYRNTFYSSLILIWQLCFSSVAIYLSMSEHLWIWFIGQNLLAINMLQWFFIEHDLGHHGFLPFQRASIFFGHIASLFCLLPFHPWQQVHHAHHKWTGWREKDPTIPEITFEQLSKTQIRLINFCWKYWVPIFAISFALQTFWNLKRLKRLFPDTKSRIRHAFSVFFILFIFFGLVAYFGTLFFKIWLLAIFIFFFISDPILLSQHTHLDYHDIEVTPLKPVRYIEQPIFCRSVVFPKWVEKYILYNTSKHGLHHQYPWVAFYDLPNWKDPEENYIHWREWLKIAKQMPAHEMIFHSTKHTGIRL